MLKNFWEKCKEHKEEIKVNIVFSLQMLVLMPVLMVMEYTLIVFFGKILLNLLGVAPVQP